MINEILADAKSHMDKSLKAIQQEMASIRTGRATSSLLDTIRVEYYGTQAPVKQVASISAPEPRLLTVHPWEPRMIPIIEKAILTANLGLNPSNDGTTIRIPIPPLNEERRRELVRMVGTLAEGARVAIRNIRRDANDLLKAYQKDGEVSEDDSRRTQEEVQEMTNEYAQKVDEILEKKEEEIMEV